MDNQIPEGHIGGEHYIVVNVVGTTTTTTANTTTTTWGGVWYPPDFTLEAHGKAKALLRESFPEQSKQYEELNFCEWGSSLYPVTYRIWSGRIDVFYNGECIGLICISAGCDMPTADRILQILLHLKRGDEKYILRTGNWERNIGYSALEHFKKSFVKKGKRVIYKPHKRKKRNWLLDGIDWNRTGEFTDW